MKEYIDCPKLYLGYVNAFYPFFDFAYVISLLAQYFSCAYLMYVDEKYTANIQLGTVVGTLFVGLIYVLFFRKAHISIFLCLQRSVIQIVSFFVIAPVAMSQQREQADNTTYWICILLTVLYLFIYDYKQIDGAVKNIKHEFDEYSGVFIMFILCQQLCSRFQNIMQCFTLMLLTLMFFVLGTKVRQNLLLGNKYFYHLVMSGVMALTNYVLYNHVKSLGAFLTYLGIIGIFNIAIPLFLMTVYPYKQIIHGPWEVPDIISYSIDKIKTMY